MAFRAAQRGDHLSDHGVITAVVNEALDGDLPRAYTDGGRRVERGESRDEIDVNINVTSISTFPNSAAGSSD